MCPKEPNNFNNMQPSTMYECNKHHQTSKESAESQPLEPAQESGRSRSSWQVLLVEGGGPTGVRRICQFSSMLASKFRSGAQPGTEHQAALAM